MSDARDEARWRDLQAEENGLLDAGQPTETAHIERVKRLRQPFTPDERRMLRVLALNDHQIRGGGSHV